MGFWINLSNRGRWAMNFPTVIICDTPWQRDAAYRLGRRLNLPVVDSNPGPSAIRLLLTSHRLELHYPELGGSIFTDFVNGAMGYRRPREKASQQPLARAIGCKQSACPTVLDATAGLGRDAFILASFGCSVVLVERSPVIAALLEDGLARAHQVLETAATAARMTLIQADSVTWMEKLNLEARPEVVYLDPLYPERRKSALVKKEMRLIRMLVEKDENAPFLLRTALECAQRRVVVKRPRLARPVQGPSPDFAIASKNTRFDVYLIGKKPQGLMKTES